MFILEYIEYAVELFYITLILYLAIMNVSRHKDNLNTVQKIIFYPIGIVGVFCDVLFRYTVGILLKLPKANKDDMLFTSVLQTYINEDSWKGKVCRFICHNFLDMFDPSGRHC